MKIRQWFVSNSSSSSFCIYGAYIREGDAEKIIKKLKLSDSSDSCCDCLGEYVRKSSNLESHYGDCSDEVDKVCLGFSWDKMRDEETLGEFKKRIEEEIRKTLTDGIEDDFDLKLGIHEEGWYNG